MSRAPLMSPGYRTPQRGFTRADILTRLALLGIIALVIPVGLWSLWLAGKLGGVVTGLRWPDSSPADAPGIAVRLLTHGGDPQRAWPAPARPDIPGGAVL